MLQDVIRLTRPLILFDFETCPEPKTRRPRAVSLGLKRYFPDRRIEEYKTLINPGCSIDTDSSRVHGITDETIATGCARCWQSKDKHPLTGPLIGGFPVCAEWKPVPHFPDLAERLKLGFCNGEVDFGGQNVIYDLDVLAYEFSLVNIVFSTKGASIIDTLRLEQHLEPRDLSNLYRKYTGQDLEGAHDAMIDVNATETVLLCQLQVHPRAADLPRTVAELGLICYKPKIRGANWIDADGKFVWIDSTVCFNFGEHRGKPIKTQMKYVWWIANKADRFSPEVKQLCRDALAGTFPTQQTPLALDSPAEGQPF